MKNKVMKRRVAAMASAAVMSVSCMSAFMNNYIFVPNDSAVTAFAADSVSILQSVGFAEGIYATWSAVSGADGYNVYVDGVQIDSMLIRQYAGYMRADAVGLTAGTHTMRVVPVISGKEDASKASETKADAYAHDRSGYAFADGHMPGAYNSDGTLKNNAVVVYVTNENKDSVSVTLPDKKGNDTAITGVQNIITNLKSNDYAPPVAIRFIGNIEDPANMPSGDLYVDAVTCGLTVEGIGNEAPFHGFGLVIKNSSDIEARNIGYMNCDSKEKDDCGLQQSDSYCWIHNCDFFYGNAGSDADQAKGDGALDTKKSHHITHSYNHFFDNGKCNLQGANSSDTSNYITYHHNWYDHSDSRHPRVRVATVHVYNNYYDGNAKYGIGSTTDSDIFAENNYFRNCKNPMMISGQGTDAAGEGTFSGEVGGMIKAFGNIIEGGVFVPYSENNTQFDAYDAKSRDEQVPSSVKAADGGATYNNFDTASDFYSYNLDAAEDVPSIVTSKAGRVDGGDFKWQFDNSVDDESYAVNQPLKDALLSYDDSILAIGSGFKDDNTNPPVVTTISTVQPPQTTTTVTTAPPVVNPPVVTDNVIYASPNGKGDGKTADTPTDALTAIKSVQAGGTIYLLEGTYNYKETILIEESNAGKAGAYKTISAYPGAKVVFDFEGQAVSGSARGFVLDGSYWHFYGFEIKNAGDNGMLLSGDNNVIEMMVFNDNEDTGLQLSRYQTSYNTIAQWPSNNLIKNCTSKNNCDEATMENADGFAAKLTCGEGNVFDGCMSYNNSDDGWDLYAKTETGPIGVVTIKNCVAFRNGFTEDGRGYGDADGNGFKLGGGGVGTRHVVENCLAFENLNCGFTDNNNPLFGDMKDCTAYNNGIGGNGKANYMVYRCASDATFANMVSYTNTSRVSKTNAAGIKLSNDKFVGKMTNSIYYNSKYYFAQSETMTNGAKLGDVVTPVDSDFITLDVPAMGTDFHTAWRNADGSPNPKGFAETASNSAYKELGYKMSNGTSQPPVSTQTTASTNSTTTTTTTTATTKTPVVAGGYVHDFTVNGTSSSFYTITGNLSTSKGTVNYNGLTLKQCLKMESATNITFNSASAGKFTLVFAEPVATIKIDGTKYTSSGDGIITVDLTAGNHTVTKADSSSLFYMVYSAEVTSSKKMGDADESGDVGINDAVLIMQSIVNPDKYQMSEQGKVNADVVDNGNGITNADALAIQYVESKTITYEAFPITSAELDALGE